MRPYTDAVDARFKLVIEIMGEEPNGGIDIDSIFLLPDGRWVIVEFIKCESVRPFDSHPNRYWHFASRKFLTLWKLTCALQGTLYWVNYEDSREQFLVIKVLALSDNGITEEEIQRMTVDEFRAFFVGLSRKVRGV
jgi:uncharacterized protein YjiS (DUF1127 family)